MSITSAIPQISEVAAIICMNQQPLIHLSNVHKSYRLGDRTINALRGVDLTLEHAGFFAIMGASGSGKSTLLHLLAGLDRADQGEITMNGCALHRADEAELVNHRRHSVGLVFQQFNLIPTMTAMENVMLPGVLGHVDRRTLRDRAVHLLDQLGVGHRSDHRPDALSGGEQQRIAIARALIYQPPLLLADEPTGNLDSENALQVWALLRSLAIERRMMVLMVTHEPSAAIHCECVHVISDGVMRGSIDVDGADAAELAARYQQLVRSQG
ncbi:MAG: ABC transporter ATP-binding protein [Phycisphaerales bacterium]